MAKPWDRSLKRLFKIVPEDLVAWLLPEATFVSVVSPELDSEDNESEAIYPDLLFEVQLNQARVILHVEFQRSRDSQMAERLWEYNLKTTRQYGCPVWSVVIYLKKDGKVAKSPLTQQLPNGRLVRHFEFDVVCLWQIPTQELQQKGLPGLLPLLPLTKNGLRREVVEEVITGLLQVKKEVLQGELLTMAYVIASLAFGKADKADQKWLIWRFAQMYDLLEDTPAYQHIKKQGLLEGLEKGRKEGLLEGEKKGGIEALRQTLQHIVAARFPKLTRLARGQSMIIDDPKELDNLIVKISLAKDIEEAKNCLIGEDSNA